MKTVLLTGGTGFIGSYVLKELLKNKYKVLLLKRKSSNLWRIKNLINKVKYYNLDEVNLESIFLENKIDIIVHLATHYIKKENFSDIETMQKTNIILPTRLLELAKKYKIKGFIDTGSFFEYKPSKLKLSEKSKRESYNLYASTKSAFREILKYYSKDFKIIRLILFSPYGPKDNPKLIQILFKSILNNSELHISKGEQQLDWTYVTDISKSYIKAIELILYDKDKSYFKEFNIGFGHPISIKIIYKKLKEITKKEFSNIFLDKEYNIKEIMFSCSNNKKSKKELNWAPTQNIDDGLNKIWDDLKNGN